MNRPLKTLLIGRSGQLGGQLLRLLEGPTLAPSRTELDLARLPEAIDYIRAASPTLVINTAAFHNVMLCEQEAAQAFGINAVAVKALAEVCAEQGARFLTFSTDYVFDGTKKAPYIESDSPNPLQVYGASKLEGEILARAAHPDGAYVIRTCGVYGVKGARQKGGNFIEQRLVEAANRETLEVGGDQTISPTYAPDLAAAVVLLLSQKDLWKPGIYHLVNQGQCTWAEFAAEAFRQIGVSTKICPVDRGGRSGTMRRPLFSALANTQAAALRVTLPHWKDALARYVNDRNQL